MTSHDGSDDEFNDDAADSVEDTVAKHPWLERLIQLGWIAKGLVYTVMGVTAFQIAQLDQAAEDEASPQGSIGQVSDAPFGRALLLVLAVGLVLYIAWRILSVAVIRGHDLSAWGDRIGYTFSALFYVTLSYTAGRAAVSGVRPEDSDSVETISTNLLESTPGRWLLGLGGVVTMCVGAYFVIHKGIQRSFTDDLEGVHESFAANEPKRKALVVSGVAGWIGRGIVTIMVGFFVLRSAYRFDPDDARGFDRALRQVAGTGLGSTMVLVAAVGLIAYGVFCFFSHRFRSID